MKKTCSVEGCDKNVRSRGWCNNHYARWQRTGHPLGAEALGRKPLPRATTEKRCAICGKVKPREAFYESATGHLSAYCRPCHAHYTKRKAQEARDRAKAERPATPKVTELPCSFDGCVYNAKTAGSGQPLCAAHDNQWRSGKELHPLGGYMESYIDNEHRRCTGCLKVKSNDAFYTRTGNTPQSRCKSCMVFIGRWGALMRQRRYVEAVDLVESMPDSLKELYEGKTFSRIKEDELERSNKETT